MNVKAKRNPLSQFLTAQGQSDRITCDQNKMRKISPYFSDPLIIERVKKYVEENSDSNYIDLDAMVTVLQKRYREYGRRKRAPFRGLVQKAFMQVVNSTMDDDPLSELGSSEEELYEEEEEEEEVEANRANHRLVTLYNREQEKKMANSKNEEKETINISSSDDEGDEKNAKKLKTDQNSKGDISKNRVPLSSSIPVPDLEKVSNIFKSTGISVRLSTPPSKKDSPKKQSATPKEKIQLTQSASFITKNTDSSKKRKASDELKGALLKKKREVAVQESQFNFANIGGNAKVLEEVCKLLVHIKHPEVYEQVGVTPPRGFLLHGPPGCGKTLLAQAIAGELNVPLLKISAPELVAGVSGESEERIRDMFDQAVSLSPCVLFLDEVDAITPHRMTAQREMERRIVAQLLTCLDELSQREGGSGVLVIGATNRPDALDPALRRAGRFDREVCLGIPNQEARADILRVLSSSLRLAPDFSYEKVAQNTPGFVGADLMALMREAAMFAVNRVFAELKVKAKLNDKQKPAIAEDCPSKIMPMKEQEEGCEGVPIHCTDDVKNDSANIENASGNEVSDNKENLEHAKSNENVESVKPLDKEETDKELKSSDSVEVDSLNEETTVSEENCKISEESTVHKENVTANCTDARKEDSGKDVSSSNEKTESSTESSGQPTLSDLVDWLHNQPPLTSDQLKNLYIEQSDFMEALKIVQPSAKREGFATVPDVTWEDVGSLKAIREELQLAILAPVRHEKQFSDLGLTMPTGVLLCGPPGCGKTLLAKAIANEAGINFISVKGPELLNMYVGESERAVRQCFQRARNSAPCVIFFDELDSLCPKRTDSREGGASMRVVNQMLTEMDGVEGRRGVFLLAATNRPDIVDPAVLRPGRLDKVLYVGLPGPQDRADILLALTKNGTKPKLAQDVNISALGSSSQCNGFTGADLAALVREAAVEALKEHLINQPSTGAELMVSEKHFQKALPKIRPSVSEKDLKHYEKLHVMYASTPGSMGDSC